MGLYDGTLVGSPTFTSTGVPSAFGQAVSLDGSTQYISIINVPASMTPGIGNPWTIRFRIYESVVAFDSIDRPLIACIDTITNATLWFIYKRNSTVIGIFGNFSQTLNSTTAIQSATWADIELSYDGSRAYLFQNGILQVSKLATNSTTANTKIVYIGTMNGINGTSLWDGLMDEIATFNICLHTANFTPPIVPYPDTTTGLVTVYHLDGNASSDDFTVPPTILSTISINSTSSVSGAAADILNLSTIAFSTLSNLSGNILIGQTLPITSINCKSGIGISFLTILSNCFINSILSGQAGYSININAQKIISTSSLIGNTGNVPQVLSQTCVNTVSSIQVFSPLLMHSISTSTASIFLESIIDRLCVITGSVPNNISAAPIIVYIKTWNKIVISKITKIEIPLSPITFYSDQVGNFTLTLIAPGDLSPDDLYYIISINGNLISTTSFDYFSGVQDISTVTQSFPTPVITTMYGLIKDSSYKGIQNAPVEVTIDAACVDLATGIEVLPSRKYFTKTDQNGVYSVQLFPTTNLIPFGRYYTVHENNNLNYKNITVPLQGGFVDDNLVTDSSVGSSKIPIEFIPAQLTETATFVATPTTLYDDMTNVRAELAVMFNQPWNSLQYNTPSIAKIGANQGSVYINGQLQINNILNVYNILSPTQALVINVRSECGVGAQLNTDSFGTTLYGMVSWESGVEVTVPGSQIDVYFTTGINGSGLIASSISPADASMANQWGNAAPYSYIETISSSLGKYILHIGFANIPFVQTTYKIFYKIRGI